MRSKLLTCAITAALAAGAASTAFADDGEIFRKNVSSQEGITENPEPEAEHAFISIMNFRVPAQAANGTLTPLTYTNIDGEDVLVDVPDAKPLISVYVYGPVIGFDDFSQSGFPGHGMREAYGAVSLDDGATWKTTNLSGSTDVSSFTLTDPIPNPADPDCHGDIENVTAALQSPVMLVDRDDDRGNGRGQGGGTGNSASPEIEKASWDAEDGELDVEGETGRRGRVEVIILNAATGEEVCTTRSDRDGEFECDVEIDTDSEVPCSVVAVVGNAESEAVDVADAPENCDDGTGEDGVCEQLYEYPGDVTNIYHATAGNKVLVAWQSKYCAAGFPGYTGGDISDADTIAGYLGIDRTADLYLEDLFVVGGNQQSTDYKEQEAFPGEYDGVGEVPYNCLWSARGVLREDPENLGTSQMVWFQAERLTSGRRDVNRIEVACTAGGGCAVTWQEDPEGLRPGEGEGAGTGWAGATTNSQTDIWYSFIKWEDFDIMNVDGTPTQLADVITDTGRPKPYVPMMVPVRLTNNARCSFPVDNTDSYCNEAVAGAYGIKNQCVGTVEVPAGPQGNLRSTCVVDANDNDTMDYGDLPNLANTAASRPRLNVQPRDSDGDGTVDDAWVIIIHEEDKGMGRYGFVNDLAWDENLDTVGVPCGDPDVDKEDNCTEADIGKNQWYISFAMGTPATSAALEQDFGLVNHIVAQQDLWNAPEVNWRTGTFYPPMSTADMWNFVSSDGNTDLNYKIFQTEIARRASLMTQSLGKAISSAQGDEALMAFPLFKEGIINQGGPADIMARRVAISLESEDRCDSWQPGSGPGGVQPFLDVAELTCVVNEEDNGEIDLDDCEIYIEGEICVAGENLGTQVILALYEGTANPSDEPLCEDFIDLVTSPDDNSTEFSGTCELEDDVVEDDGLPCTVKVITGPGTTAGGGQQSDPIDVDLGDLADVVECGVPLGD